MSTPGRAPGRGFIEDLLKPHSAVPSEVTAFADLVRYNDTKIFVTCVFVCRYVYESAGAPKGHKRGSVPWSCITDSCELLC